VNGTPTFYINGVRHDDSYETEVLSKRSSGRPQAHERTHRWSLIGGDGTGRSVDENDGEELEGESCGADHPLLPTFEERHRRRPRAS
jgi:hypothetical protein